MLIPSIRVSFIVSFFAHHHLLAATKSMKIVPVFRLLDHLLGVKRGKSLCATFFQLRGLESYGDFLDQRLILFVRENYCNCASRGKFCANEFFKHAYKISKSSQHKRIFDVRKWTLRGQFTRCQRTITLPKLPEWSKHGSQTFKNPLVQFKIHITTHVALSGMTIKSVCKGAFKCFTDSKVSFFKVLISWFFEQSCAVDTTRISRSSCHKWVLEDSQESSELHI